ncbi:hypothetical protein [Paenibacillus agricola]|uniref:hypothetical protein n=1 Tax=Paenibacillus agricola TaxID=2716264 RepID=UPI001A9D312A|nr:hypothetical protein [Paenibacillus agricola]
MPSGLPLACGEAAGFSGRYRPFGTRLVWQRMRVVRQRWIRVAVPSGFACLGGGCGGRWRVDGQGFQGIFLRDYDCFVVISFNFLWYSGIVQSNENIPKALQVV